METDQPPKAIVEAAAASAKSADDTASVVEKPPPSQQPPPSSDSASGNTADPPPNTATIDQPMEADGTATTANAEQEQLEESQNNSEALPPELEMREEVNSTPTPGEQQELLQENGNKDHDYSTNTAVANGIPEKPDDEPIQTAEEMRKIILTQGQLKRLATVNNVDAFRQAVTGCYVRVNVPGLPQQYNDRIFIDQIVDVLEPQSYQHLWLNRRYRLRNLGDFELDKIVSHQTQDNDLRPWFDYLEAKGESLPIREFVKQKEAAIDALFQQVKAKDAADEEGGVSKSPAKGMVDIKRDNLAQIALNPVTLRNLAKLDFERFRKTVTGCFVCMQAIRKDKPKDCQYHIVRVLDCVQGPRQYKVRNMALVNYQLVLPFYGKYIINWVKSFTIVTDAGFRTWLEDMRSWNEPIPTLDAIRDKAAQLQLALTEAQIIPSFVDLEKQRQQQEERAKRAKLPVQTAKELDACCLTRGQLQTLAGLQDVEQLTKVLAGCYVRVNAGETANKFEIDQIMSLEVKDEQQQKKGKGVLELKFAGTISLTALTYLTSTFKFTEAEFKEFAKKLETDEEEALPTHEFVDRKAEEIQKALQQAAPPAEQAKEQQKTSVAEQAKTGTVETAAATGSGSSKPGEKQRDAQQNGKDKESSSASTAAKETKEKEAAAVERKAAGTKEFLTVPVKDGQLSASECRRIVVSLRKMIDLMACEKDVLVRVLRGFYARIAQKRSDKPNNQQYYVDQIIGVSWGGEPYRIRNALLTDIRLHTKHFGVHPLHQLYRTQGDNFNDEALQLFQEDMKKWKMDLPTLAQIERKNRDYTTAIAKAPKVPRSAFSSSRASVNTYRPKESAFIGGASARVPYQAQAQQNMPTFDHVQQMLHNKIVSAVRTTPGLGLGTGSWMNSPANLQQQPQQMANFSSPPRGGGAQQQFLLETPPVNTSWQKQTAAFISSSNSVGGTKRPLEQYQQQQSLQQHQSLLQQERESWRMQQQQQQIEMKQQEPRVDQFGQYNRSVGGIGGAESLMSLRDFPALRAQSPPVYARRQELLQQPQPYDYRRSLEMDHMFGPGGAAASAVDQQRSSIPQLKQLNSSSGAGMGMLYGGGLVASSSGMQQHYNTYVPSAPKRARHGGHSPQPPPVERFF